MKTAKTMPQQVPLLTVEQMISEWERWAKMKHNASIHLVVSAVILCASMYLHVTASTDPGRNLFTLIYVLAGASTVYASMRMRCTDKTKRLIHSLSLLEDSRAIGPLAEVLEIGSVELRRVAVNRLTSLLNTCEVVCLTDRQASCLSYSLDSKNTDFVLSILNYMRNTNDNRIYNAVDRLLSKNKSASAATHLYRLYSNSRYEQQDVGTRNIETIRIQALNYKQELQKTIHKEGESQTLLRSADGVQIGANTLLRATALTVSETPDEMLRASQTHE